MWIIKYLEQMRQILLIMHGTLLLNTHDPLETFSN